VCERDLSHRNRARASLSLASCVRFAPLRRRDGASLGGGDIMGVLGGSGGGEMMSMIPQLMRHQRR
jgi:hypothetical protein